MMRNTATTTIYTFARLPGFSLPLNPKKQTNMHTAATAVLPIIKHSHDNNVHVCKNKHNNNNEK